MPQTPGKLFIVATPIGNLDDISQRAIQTLSTVDTIIAEDTRHSQKLLNHLGIKKPILSFHSHNEHAKSSDILAQIEQGKSIALVSDAGTPLISDPGYPLVSTARQQGFEVSPIPGPSALIAALSASGLSCDRFQFNGFLPAKQSGRLAQLNTIKDSPITQVFYESTHRIKACLEDMQSVFGDDRGMVLAKELTKTFETFIIGTAQELLAWLNQEEARTKGEFVLIIEGAKEQSLDDKHILTTLKILLEELPLKKAAKLTAQLTGCAKNHAYQLGLEI